MASVPIGSYLGKEDGIHVAISSWTRVSDNAIPARGKIAGSYVNSALAKTDAVLAGFDEALLLNEHGHVCEGSVENVFMVTGRRRRDAAGDRRRARGLHPRHRDAAPARGPRSHGGRARRSTAPELYLAEEVFLTGTGAEISPVTRVDHRLLGDGRIGPVASSVRTRYLETVCGRVLARRGWCRPVYAPAAAETATAVAQAPGVVA